MIWAPQNWSLSVIIFNIVNGFVIKMLVSVLMM